MRSDHIGVEVDIQNLQCVIDRANAGNHIAVVQITPASILRGGSCELEMVQQQADAFGGV